MTSPVRHQERTNPAEDEDTTPCHQCGAALSRYVSKCPKCGHHAHRLSHDEINARRESRQKWMLVLSALGVAVLILLAALYMSLT